MKKNITKVLFTILIMFLTISVKADNFTFYNPVENLLVHKVLLL